MTRESRLSLFAIVKSPDCNWQKTLLVVILIMFSIPVTFGQNGKVNQQEDLAVKQAVFDFYEGYYSGNVARVEKAIHQDINRATPRNIPQTGRTMLTYSTYSLLIENTRAKVGVLDDTARHINVLILNIDNDVANVKVTSSNFTDYIQLVRLDSNWKMINVLSTSGTNLPPRLSNFKPEDERAAIEQTSLNYLSGISGADFGRLEISVSPEFSKITIIPYAATGKTSLRRQRYESLLENSLASLGKQDEIYRNNRVAILDITDGLAVVKCDMVNSYEFVQLFNNGGKWQILNSISKAVTSITFDQAITATVGKPMPDFALPVYGGGEFNLAKYRGKNVLLMFPRGWIGTQWCPYCPYQYLELEQLEKSSGLEAKNNLEIAFIMPYSREKIKDWMEKFPEALQTIEAIKNPEPKPAAGSFQSDFVSWANTSFPLQFDVKPNDPHKIIPVLVDENRTLSRQLKIFTNFWDGIASEQNMASVFIIDKNGILRFKYISQMTEDRPSVEFLIDSIKKLK